MLPKIDYTNITDLRGAADIIEEKDELTTYLGFCTAGTPDTAAASWSILKIVQSGNAYPKETRFLWANGLCSFNKAWTGRAGYDYIFKKF